MKYIIEILSDNYKEIIATKRTYTIEEAREFYKDGYVDFPYRIYEITDINVCD